VNPQYNLSKILLYLLFTVGIGAIFLSHPFMRYPYDMWAHLISIDNSYDYTSIPEGRRVWHLIWREIFDFFGISRRDILLRGDIIHRVQAVISFGAIYLFSLVVIRNLYIQVESLHHRYMALWSTLLWFTLFATFSTFYHHTWILWYSISYQVTLPLFFYITSLTLILFLERNSWYKKVLYTLQIITLSLFILKVHSMEYFYYLLYITILFIIFAKDTWRIFKKYSYFFIVVIVVLLLFANSYHGDEARLLSYLYSFQFEELYQLIVYEGTLLVNGINRAEASINEMMVVILFSTLFMILSLYKSPLVLSRKMFLFLLITSLFVVIPLFVWSAGLASLFTKLSVVNRIYYSASLFVLLPISLYALTAYCNSGRHLLVFNISLIVIIFSTFFYSKYYAKSPVYYANIQSLKQSLFEEKVRFNLSKEEIETLGKELLKYPQSSASMEVLFWARADIAVVLKYIYHKDVFWRGRRATPSKKKFEDYCATLNPQEIRCELFQTPKNFPSYSPYK